MVIYNIFSFSYGILTLLRAQKSLPLQFHLPSYLLFLTMSTYQVKNVVQRSVCMHLSVWTFTKGFGFPLSTDHFSLTAYRVGVTAAWLSPALPVQNILLLQPLSLHRYICIHTYGHLRHAHVYIHTYMLSSQFTRAHLNDCTKIVYG